MKIEESEVWLLVGASRGLGFEFFKKVQELQTPRDRPIRMVLLSRTQGSLASLLREESWFSVDLSKPEEVERFLELNLPPQITRLIYFAGGGPYGRFQAKNWKDHEWAWRVSFLSAARFLHYFLRSPHFKQGIFIGSQIAERNPDINAASYTAAKHALLGIISTLQKEALEEKDTKKASLAHDLRLFSPGYMNTSLLPPTAWPRLGGAEVFEPGILAAELLQWMQDSNFSCQNWSKSTL
ncbi:MAG: SDR family NAD(P)-dependent oxidoreductase [Bdellovibrionaceae bacterium]|nr:SDR family NAD(P)-dependent oxidoreductase [Pseudobdellovibrionaceae bacterium]